MKDPALQMRLKTQLSGGRVPHLLQTERRRTGRSQEEQVERVQSSPRPTSDQQGAPFGFPAGPDFLLSVKRSISGLF